jgi:pheromone shutdown protein TraB
MGLQGLLHVLAGGKLLSGLLVGAALGTALSTTVYVLVPAIQSQAAPEVKARAPAASPPVRVNAKESSALVIAEPIRPVVSATPVSSTLADKLPRASVTPLREQGPARNPPLRSRSTDSSANGSDRLAEEAQALAQVQDALSRKDPGAAWALLQEQDRQFGLGQLAEERAAARVMALCGAGRYREAAQVRDTFFSSYPNSPLTNRVKKGCAQQ